MLKFFKRENPREIGANLAKVASIETVYDEGKISSFIIQLSENYPKLKEKLKNRETTTEFVNIIEERLRNDNFKNTRPSALDDIEPYKTKNIDIAEAKRAVFSLELRPIFDWKSQNNSKIERMPNEMPENISELDELYQMVEKNKKEYAQTVVTALSSGNSTIISEVCEMIKRELIPALNKDKGQSKESSLNTLNNLIKERRPPKDKYEYNDIENAAFFHLIGAFPDE